MHIPLIFIIGLVSEGDYQWLCDLQRYIVRFWGVEKSSSRILDSSILDSGFGSSYKLFKENLIYFLLIFNLFNYSARDRRSKFSSLCTQKRLSRGTLTSTWEKCRDSRILCSNLEHVLNQSDSLALRSFSKLEAKKRLIDPNTLKSGNIPDFSHKLWAYYKLKLFSQVGSPRVNAKSVKYFSLEAVVLDLVGPAWESSFFCTLTRKEKS